METKPNTWIFVLVGITGAGKSTLLKILHRGPLTRDLVDAPVSATTRPVRAKDIPGETYHFWTLWQFFWAVITRKFVEYARIHGNFYGVLKSEIDAILAKGRPVVVDVNIDGAFKLREKYGEQVVLIWVDGPKTEAGVVERLRARDKKITESEIRRRLRTSKRELRHRQRFDFTVDNSGSTPETATIEMMDIVLRKLERPLRFKAFEEV